MLGTKRVGLIVVAGLVLLITDYIALYAVNRFGGYPLQLSQVIGFALPPTLIFLFVIAALVIAPRLRRR